MEYNTGKLHGLQIALVAIERLHNHPSDYKKIKELLEQFVGKTEAEINSELEKMEKEFNKEGK